MKPAFITFTGADGRTSVSGMRALAAQYPIEWGLLFSPKRQGQGRYPPLDWIKEVVAREPLRFAAHLCGEDARDVIGLGYGRHDELLHDHFDRAQINTTAHVSPYDMDVWARVLALRPILQCRGPFPQDSRYVDWLFDKSGGRGIVQTIWPQPPLQQFCGYAGGLNPGNVQEAVAAMVAGSTNAEYWIDMESGVRDEHDRFSLDKCRAVCEAVYGSPA